MRDGPDARVRPKPFVRGQACFIPRHGSASGTCGPRSSCPSISQQDRPHPSMCPTLPPPCLIGPMRAWSATSRMEIALKPTCRCRSCCSPT
eukprot:1907327-Pleurochrysis_carterae.AAC.1